MVAVRKDRICRPDGAEILFWFWFYKYVAPTALGMGRSRSDGWKLAGYAVAGDNPTIAQPFMAG